MRVLSLFLLLLLFSLSAHQLSCFLDMKLQYVYHALQVFVQWIEDGYYDFRSLPYATKSHLCAEDEQKLQQLQEQAYHGKHRSQTYTLSVDIWEFMSSQGALLLISS